MEKKPLEHTGEGTATAQVSPLRDKVTRDNRGDTQISHTPGSRAGEWQPRDALEAEKKKKQQQKTKQNTEEAWASG